MKTVPFLAFTTVERAAVLRLLRKAGIAPAEACVSRLEFTDSVLPPEHGALTLVSTAQGCRSFRSLADEEWLGAFDRELPLA